MPPLLRLICLAAALLVVTGCKARPPATPSAAPAAAAPTESPVAGATGSPATVAPAPTPAPTPGKGARDPSLLWENDLSALSSDYGCELKEVVADASRPDDPRGAIWRAYEAARKAVVDGVDGTHADEFVDQFTRLQKRGWILEQYWPRIKTHISKYTLNSKETSFVLCRVEERDGRWKAFVKSFGRDKSNPPITVEIEDGVPRISFFTY